MRMTCRIWISVILIWFPFFGMGAARAEEGVSSLSVYPPRVMAWQPLLARAMYGGEGEEAGSRLTLRSADEVLLSRGGNVIFLAHFEGDLQAKGGWVPDESKLSYSEKAVFGKGALRLDEGSSLIYREIPDSFNPKSGSVLMWVAPDTQTVFVTPDETLYYEMADDGSLLSLSLSKHHLKARWKGRGRGDTKDKKSAMDAREWHMVGMSWGYPEKDLVTIYLDGGFWYSKKEKYRPSGRPREIGIGTGVGGSSSFRGLIDEVMITGSALSKEEVFALYEAGHDARLPFPDQFAAVMVDSAWAGKPLAFDYLPRNSQGRAYATVSSEAIVPEEPHALLQIGLGRLTTTPFDLIGAELTYDCLHPDSSTKFPAVRMWESPRCNSLEEDRGKPRRRVLESMKSFQLARPGSPLVRIFWNGGEGAVYRYDKNAANPPDRVDHVREFLDSLSIRFPQSIMLFAETAQSDERTSDFDTSLIRYMHTRYGENRPRYYECINEMIYAEGWGTKSDNDSALVWNWKDGYYHSGGRCWTHMVEDTLSGFFEGARAIDKELSLGWFIDRQGGWNFDGMPAGLMEQWRQDSILLSNEAILEHTGFLSFHDYFPISMGAGENSLANGLTRAVGSLGWKHAYVNPKTWRLFAKYFGHPEWEMMQTEYNTAAANRSPRMPAGAERLFDTWAGAWANISNFILRAKAGEIDKAMYFKVGYAYGDTPHATVNYANGRAHRSVIEKAFGRFGSLMRDSTLAADSVWTYGFTSERTAHNWGMTGMPVLGALSTISPDSDTVAILLVNRDWRHRFPLEVVMEPPLAPDPDHDTAFFHHVAFGPTSKGANDDPDTSLLESWGKGYYYPSDTKFDSTDVNFVCDTLPGFSTHMSVELERAVFGVLELPVRVKDRIERRAR